MKWPWVSRRRHDRLRMQMTAQSDLIGFWYERHEIQRRLTAERRSACIRATETVWQREHEISVLHESLDKAAASEVSAIATALEARSERDKYRVICVEHGLSS